MQIMQKRLVAPRSAHAFTLRQGQTVRIVDVAGGQPGDFVAFNQHDLAERFSQSRTRVENRSCRVTTGGRLWTNAIHPRIMFTIMADTAGTHDLLYTPCCRYALEKRFGISGDGCLENLARSLASWGLKPLDVPDPLNLFFDVGVAPDGALAIGKHRSQPGDLIELRAEMDCLVAVSTCSVPMEGRNNSAYRLEIDPTV